MQPCGSNSAKYERGKAPDRPWLVIQISTPVQTGNSGGPLLDLAASVVGVMVAKLDAILIANVTGAPRTSI